MRILQVSSADIAGGAEKVAFNLFRQYRARGHESHLAVRIKRSNDPDVLPIPNAERRPSWTKFWLRAAGLEENRSANDGLSKWAPFARGLGEPHRVFSQKMGYEDFDFPATWDLLKLSANTPDIVHAHNLHGDYFDLRALPWLSKQVPLVLTLHDAWLLSGHCSHHFECDRWQRGCGQCPDLTIYPAVQRDATAYNWGRKKRIFERSRFYISTPCRWLLEKVEKSILLPAIIESRIIPYGIDCSVFQPANKEQARAKLGLPEGAKVILFAANRIRKNIWKDYETMKAATVQAAKQFSGGQLVFVGLGDEGPKEAFANGEFRFYPYRTDQRDVAAFYQAADVYLHAANADTFPNAVLEALATGTPVIATAVGGIPEQIEDGQTGYLVPLANVSAMAKRISELLADPQRLTEMGTAAAASARHRFCIEREVNDYLNWYEQILTNDPNHGPRAT